MDLCPIEECDVEDKESLRKYRECLLRWNKWLFDDPHNALINQILRMLQYDATYRMINLAREFSVNTPNKNVGFNWLFLQSYDYGYASSQLSMIRKLACDSREDVISLKRIIKDMKVNHKLFTRENYVCYNSYPFDNRNGENSFHTRLRHESFDKLCHGTNTKVSNRKQIVPIALFDKVTSKLGSCNNLTPVVNNFIAHAGDLSTHTQDGVQKSKVTLDRISQCHKEICQTFNFISGHLLSIGSSGLMPSFLGTPSENLDKAFALTENLHKLNEFWDNHEKSIESWNQEIISGKWLK